MNINDALKGSTAGNDVLQRIHYVRGQLVADSKPENFRIYPIPNDEGTYFVVSRNDVAGDIYELAKEELIGTGFAGVKVHKVPLSLGTNVAFVKVKIHKIGETISSDSFEKNSASPAVVPPPGCSATSGCQTGCCTAQGAGGPCYCDTCCTA